MATDFGGEKSWTLRWAIHDLVSYICNLLCWCDHPDPEPLTGGWLDAKRDELRRTLSNTRDALSCFGDDTVIADVEPASLTRRLRKLEKLCLNLVTMLHAHPALSTKPPREWSSPADRSLVDDIAKIGEIKQELERIVDWLVEQKPAAQAEAVAAETPTQLAAIVDESFGPGQLRNPRDESSVTKPDALGKPIGPEQLRTAAEAALSMVKTIRDWLPVIGETSRKSDPAVIDTLFEAARSDYTTFERIRNPQRYQWPCLRGCYNLQTSSNRMAGVYDELCRAMGRVCEVYGWQGISDESRIPRSMSRYDGPPIPPIDGGVLDAVEYAARRMVDDFTEGVEQLSRDINAVPDVVAQERGAGHDSGRITKDVNTDPVTIEWAYQEWLATGIRLDELRGLGVDIQPPLQLPDWSKQRFQTERVYRLDLTSVFQTVRNRLAQERNKAVEPRDKLQRKEPPASVANDADTIIAIGGRCYRIGDSRPYQVTESEDNVLTAFLELAAMDESTLKNKSGVPRARDVLRFLQTKYDGVFALAIDRPGTKGQGGYHVRIRRAE